MSTGSLQQSTIPCATCRGKKSRSLCVSDARKLMFPLKFDKFIASGDIEGMRGGGSEYLTQTSPGCLGLLSSFRWDTLATTTRPLLRRMEPKQQIQPRWMNKIGFKSIYLVKQSVFVAMRNVSTATRTFELLPAYIPDRVPGPCILHTLCTHICKCTCIQWILRGWHPRSWQ